MSAFTFGSCAKKVAQLPLINGAEWLASDSAHINAHGGGVMYYDGKYYWYGENRPAKGFKSEAGVNCYSSSDLRNWTNEGLVLSVSDEPGHDIESGCIIERPKVIYNKNTGKFVMWFHLELKGRGYEAARGAVAVADKPMGPFRYLESGRVNAGIYPENMPAQYRTAQWSDTLTWWTPTWRKAVDEGMLCVRDVPGGQMARDQTVYVDDDGRAYHIYSAEENLTLNIAELDSTYTRHTGRYIRVAPGGHNEAPAVMKHGGKYWMITSGCTGWAPNEARMMSADSLMGQWTIHPNPCRGEDAKLTYGGQSTYIMPIAGAEGKFVAMFDRWRPKNLRDSRYVWLPVLFTPDGTPYLDWKEEVIF